MHLCKIRFLFLPLLYQIFELLYLFLANKKRTLLVLARFEYLFLKSKFIYITKQICFSGLNFLSPKNVKKSKKLILSL